MNKDVLKGLLLGVMLVLGICTVVGAIYVFGFSGSDSIHSSACGGWTGVENRYCSFQTSGDDVSIGANSCTFPGSCLRLGKGVTIGKGSCKAEGVCSGLRSGTIGDGKCLSVRVTCRTTDGRVLK